MNILSLWDRVSYNVKKMREGERVTVGKIASIEGVSKSPQLYDIMNRLVHEGWLVVHEEKHSNGHPMFVYTRTSLPSSLFSLRAGN